MRKLPAVLLSALLFISCLAACGDGSAGTDGSPKPEETAPAAAETTTSLTDMIPSADYGGHEFRFIHDSDSSTWYGSSIYAEEQTGAILDDTVYERNHYVGEKLNVKISCEYAGDSLTKLRGSVLSGSSDYDASYMMVRDNLYAAVEGLLCNLYDVDGLDLQAQWWDGNSIDNFTIRKGKLWFAENDINTNILGQATLIIYNRDMQNNYGLEDCYTLVKDRKWTLTKMYEMAKVVNTDTDGDGKPTMGDIFGLAAGMGSCSSLINGAGQLIVGLTDDGGISYRVSEPDFIEVVELVAKMFFDPQTTTIVNDQSWGNKNFYDGNALFFTEARANNLIQISKDVDFLYGVLPEPLKNEEQDRFYSANYYFVAALALPLVQENAARTADVIEALAIYSNAYLTDAYYDTTLIGKCARDENTEQMLDIVFSSRIYDYAIAFALDATANSWVELYNNIKKNGADGLSSLWEKKHQAVETAWAKTVESLDSH